MTSVENLYDFPRTVFGAHTVIAGASNVPRSTSLEDRLAVLEFDRAARNFVAKYAFMFDSKNLEGLMALYADECLLVNSNGTYHGVEAIRRAQENDMPVTEVSFHHMDDIYVSVDDGARHGWVAAYMYNLAIRDEQPYGTVATILFELRLDAGGLYALTCRIAIDSRHQLVPKEMVIQPSSLASAPETSATLVGMTPRFPRA